LKIYVILPPDAIGEVMRGERTELPTVAPAPVGAIVAVKRARNRRPTCLLEVTDCQPDTDGHTLTVRISPNEHEPLLLAADSSRGYTNDPRLALKGEPEAVQIEILHERWKYRSAKRLTEARSEPQRRHRARELERQVRSLALADDPKVDRIEMILKEAA
jgi:hypothetical protein